MTLEAEDQYEKTLWQPSSGPVQFTEMIEFLRQRYNSYPEEPSRAPTREARFFLVNITVDKHLQKYGPGWRRRKVALYFQKSNLYLRGWTIDGDAPEDRFMAAWDAIEFNRSGATDLLPGWRNGQAGAGYVGSPPGRKGPYINISYNNSESDEDKFSRTDLFTHANTLYIYLRRIKDAGGQPSESTIREGIAGAQAALHSLAKMTSEMARFDPYRERLHFRWAQGISSGDRPASGFDWGRPTEDMLMPKFSWTLKNWKKFSEKSKADDGAGESPAFEYDGVPITPGMAREVLGANGVRWRRVS
ncbi:hypothetical protein AB0M34_13170 [Nocardia sp. NPDC050193]